MNPSDFIQGLNSIYESGMTATVIFLSVFSGYMVVAYAAGKDLNPLQAHFVSALFVVFSVFFSIGAFMFSQRAVEFINNYGEVPAAGFAIYSGYVILVVNFLAITGAVIFMYEIRNRK